MDRKPDCCKSHMLTNAVVEKKDHNVSFMGYPVRFLQVIHWAKIYIYVD